MRMMLVWLAAGMVSAAVHADQPPNIVFILADDAGLGDFGCYGGKIVRTPHIDTLAAGGMTFTNAYSGSAVCAPTRCVLMTGLHTGHATRRANQSPHGLIPLTSADPCVAQLLKARGYATGGFGKWGLGNPATAGVPEAKGFDLFFGYYDQVHAHSYFPDHLIRNSQVVPLAGNAGGRQETYAHQLIVDETLRFIELNKDGPFFVYACWTLPHGKFEIPSDAPYSDQPWPQPVKNHAAMITRLDADVGRLMAKLQSLGLDEQTLVIFSSDNGAEGPGVGTFHSTAGLRGGKRDLHEGGIRAPFIARWPGRIAPGSVSHALVSHVDFLATAADLAGAAPTAPTDGVSLLPALAGNPLPGREHLYWEIHEGRSPFQQAVRWRQWKGYRTGTRAALELYDLSADPAEKHNVASVHPQVVARLESILAAEHSPSPHWIAPEQATVPGKGNSGKKKKGGA